MGEVPLYSRLMPRALWWGGEGGKGREGREGGGGIQKILKVIYFFLGYEALSESVCRFRVRQSDGHVLAST